MIIKWCPVLFVGVFYNTNAIHRVSYVYSQTVYVLHTVNSAGSSYLSLWHRYILYKGKD